MRFGRLPASEEPVWVDRRLSDARKARYGWTHKVLLERVVDHLPGARYPWVLGGARACPPDDVGGVSGYAHFLQAMRQPQHSEHEEMMEWHGGPFDPAAFDLRAMNRAFHGGWAPPTRTANLRMQGTAPKSRLRQPCFRRS